MKKLSILVAAICLFVFCILESFDASLTLQNIFLYLGDICAIIFIYLYNKKEA
jgi:hypothetical protein